jgi:UDP-N-acetylmuramate--alanine ligase
VVTNLDREHMDCYSSMEDVEAAFVEFVDRLPFYGAATVCLDNERLRRILPRVRRKVYTYGQHAEADFRLQMLPRTEAAHAAFEVNFKGLLLGPFALHVPGHHNVLNATAAVAVGVQLGVAPEEIAAGLATFRGVDRRFQTKGKAGGVTVVDDYGHHPTEIVATLKAARECGFGRVHVIFQPHRYTRTLDLQEEFAGAFTHADSVQVLDIYAASEEPIAGVTGAALAASIHGCEAAYSASVADAIRAVVARASAGDVILTQGAGSVSAIAPQLLEALERQPTEARV